MTRLMKLFSVAVIAAVMLFTLSAFAPKASAQAPDPPGYHCVLQPDQSRHCTKVAPADEKEATTTLTVSVPVATRVEPIELNVQPVAGWFSPFTVFAFLAGVLLTVLFVFLFSGRHRGAAAAFVLAGLVGFLALSAPKVAMAEEQADMIIMAPPPAIPPTPPQPPVACADAGQQAKARSRLGLAQRDALSKGIAGCGNLDGANQKECVKTVAEASATGDKETKQAAVLGGLVVKDKDGKDALVKAEAGVAAHGGSITTYTGGTYEIHVNSPPVRASTVKAEAKKLKKAKAKPKLKCLKVKGKKYLRCVPAGK